MLYFSLGLHLVKERHQVQLLRAFPYGYGYIVHQIHVYAVRVKASELFFKNLSHAGFIFSQPDRHLVRQHHLFAVAVLQRFAQDFLAFAVVVHICRVHIVHTFVDGCPDDPDSFGFIHLVIGSLGQAHTSPAQQ